MRILSLFARPATRPREDLPQPRLKGNPLHHHLLGVCTHPSHPDHCTRTSLLLHTHTVHLDAHSGLTLGLILIYSSSVVHSLSIHRPFTVHSQSIRSSFTVLFIHCSVTVHPLFIHCPFTVHPLFSFTLHSLLIHSWPILDSLFIHSSFTLHSLFIHSWPILDSHFTHSSFTLHSLFIHSSFTLDSLLAHS